jgi:protein CpxP
MTSFRKHLLIGIAALGLGAGSFAAYADMPDGTHMGKPEGMARDHGKMGPAMRERMEKRMTELHDKLKLNASQESAWKTYTAKMKPAERPPQGDRAEWDKLTTPQRMDKMLERMKESEQRMAERAAATKDFYALLTPEQKKTFDDAFRHGPGHEGRSGPK